MWGTSYMIKSRVMPGSLVGPSPWSRLNDPGATNSHGNTLLRYDWGVEDMLRGAMGTYYGGGGGDLTQGYLTQDYMQLPGVTPPNTWGSKGAFQGGLVLGYNRLSPLTVQVMGNIDNLGPYGNRFVINPNLAVWNRHDKSGNTQDSIAADVVKHPTGVGDNWMNYSGDPNWALFVRGSVGQHDWSTSTGQPNPPGGAPVTTDLPGVVDTMSIFTDHATEFFRLSDDPGDRASSGIELVVEPVYNYYAHSSPPYEKISREASEPMLTNYYCLQSLMRAASDNRENESVIMQQLVEEKLIPSDTDASLLDSSGVAQEYFQQVTLEGKLQNLDPDGDEVPDPLFVDLNPTVGSPPVYSLEKQQRLYKLYSQGIYELKISNQLDGVKDDFDLKYKNMVMLASDVASLSKLGIGDLDASGVSHLPFYNKITIPGYAMVHEVPYIGMIRNALNAQAPGDGDKFVDVLQMYISQNILGPAEPTYINSVIHNSQAAGNAAGVTRDNSALIPKVFDLSQFIMDCRRFTSHPDTALTFSDVQAPIQFAIQRITNSLNWSESMGDTNALQHGTQAGLIADNMSTPVAGDNFVLLRDNEAEFDSLSSYSQAISNFISLVDSDNMPQYHAARPKGWPARPAVNLLLSGVGGTAPNETLMYEIKKRLLNPDGTPGTTVQRILIGKDYGGGPITYIDSQVKYGVRYFYEIRAIRMVYGNAYTYRDLHVKTQPGYLNFRSAGSRAAAQAFGFAEDPTAPDYFSAVVENQFRYRYANDGQHLQDINEDNRDQGPTPPPGMGQNWVRTNYRTKKFGYFVWYGRPNPGQAQALSDLADTGTGWAYAAGSGENLAILGTNHPRIVLHDLKLRFNPMDDVGTATYPAVVPESYRRS